MRAADGLDDAQLRTLLVGTRRIAVVGASNKPQRPSWGVTGFLVQQGYAVVSVNPGLTGQILHGQTVAASLDQAGPLDMVDLYRSIDQIDDAVSDAIRLGARSIWMQLGLVHEAAASRARAAGVMVVMDRCPAIEIPRLGLPPRPA